MVSTQVEVISRKAGEEQAWHWQSDGQTGFNVREATKEEAATLTDNHGTALKLHMKTDAIDYLLDDKIKQIILSYSDHIEIPIYLESKVEPQKEGEEDKPEEPINAASALWTRPKNEITEEQYKEFYHHIGPRL